MKILPIFGLMLLALAFLPGAALAHKVNLFAYADQGKVHTESYFSDGTKVAKGKIQVLDSRGELLLEGTTDGEGLFSFPVPKIDDLTIQVDAGLGHRGTFRLKRSDVEAGQ